MNKWQLRNYRKVYIDFVDDNGKPFIQGLTEANTVLAEGTEEEMEILAEVYRENNILVYWEKL